MRAPNWTHERPCFFKYTNRQVAKILLTDRTIRWSTPSYLNDPYDMQLNLLLGIDRRALKAEALKRLWNAHYVPGAPVPQNQLGKLIEAARDFFPRLTRKNFNQQFGGTLEKSIAAVERSLPSVRAEVRNRLQRGKVLCLTETPDNMLMWTHYAENQQGVVFRFRCIPELDSAWGIAKPVTYVSTMPRLINNDFFLGLLFDPLPQVVERITDKLVYTKAMTWAYEKEWRMFAGIGRDPDRPYEDLRFHPSELDAVILGARMPPLDRDDITRLTHATYPHAEILQSEVAQDDFRLDIVPIAQSQNV